MDTNNENSVDPFQTVTRQVTLPPQIDPISVLGPGDELLRTIEDGFETVDIMARGNILTLNGEVGQVELATELIEELVQLARGGKTLTRDAVEHAISLLRGAHIRGQNAINPTELSIKGKVIRPKTDGQARYVEAIEAQTIVFGIGPAGTGKTYLAMAKAVDYLLRGEVKRIVLTRPAVEAGESLGYLPGTLTEKIDPYLRPLYDALHDMLDAEALPKLMAAGTIEVAPLAYMRGRTLNDSFIILDEAQNTTPQQMKMFLTRLGFNSKVVVTGDTSQVDLPSGTRSGLKVVEDILVGIKGIEFCYLTSKDVVRHELVSAIIDAYGAWDAKQQALAALGGKTAGKGGGRGRKR